MANVLTLLSIARCLCFVEQGWLAVNLAASVRSEKCKPQRAQVLCTTVRSHNRVAPQRYRESRQLAGNGNVVKGWD